MNPVKKSSGSEDFLKIEEPEPHIAGLKILAAMIAKCYSQHYRQKEAQISTTLNHGSKSISGQRQLKGMKDKSEGASE